MFIDDEMLAERHRRENHLPALMIALTTIVACLVTVAGAISSIA